tara:strand:- start:189 stop:476 length:288 start_codon:yes stop_codon:yes gene_type:complete
MKPRLVEHLFQSPKQISNPVPKIKEKIIVKQVPQIIYQHIDYTPIIINFLCIIAIILGGYYLYHRQTTKKSNQQKHIQKIHNLSRRLNLKKNIVF